MLEIAKKIYNGITDQRVFRLLILVSMFFVWGELTTQAERMRNAVSTLNGIESDTERCRDRTSWIMNELVQIEDEAEEIREISSGISGTISFELERIRGYASEISHYAEGIRNNTN